MGSIFFAARAGVAGGHIPAEAALEGEGGGRLRGGHQLHGFRCEDGRSAVEEAARVFGEVGRGCEESSVSGDAGGLARARIVHDAAQCLAIGDGGGRHAGVFDGGRVVAGIGHFQRAKNFFIAKHINALACEAADYFIEQLKINVAVFECCAGRCPEFFGDAFGDAFGVAIPAVHGNIRTQSAGMREQVTHGNGFASIASEFGNKFFDGILNAQAPALVQQQNGGRGGDDFGERGGIVNRIAPREGVDGLKLAVPVGFGEMYTIAFEPQDAAGQPFFGARLGDGGGDGVDFLEVKSGRQLRGWRRGIGPLQAGRAKNQRRDDYLNTHKHLPSKYPSARREARSLPWRAGSGMIFANTL